MSIKRDRARFFARTKHAKNHEKSAVVRTSEKGQKVDCFSSCNMSLRLIVANRHSSAHALVHGS